MLADVVEPRYMRAAQLVVDFWRMYPEDLAAMDATDSLEELHSYRTTLYDVINTKSEGLLATLVKPSNEWVITVGTACALLNEQL